MVWNFSKFEDRTAIIDDSDKTVTYKDLKEFSKRINEIIDKRCLVFLLCRNTIGSIFGYLAFIDNRIVPALLNDKLDRQLLDELIKTYSPEYLWVPQTDEDLYKEYQIVLRSFDYLLLKTEFAQKYPLFEDLALLLTTSGSTGSPKFVRQSYKNILSNAQAIAKYLEITQDEKPITTLPMNYTYGLSIINSHILVGATIVTTDKSILQTEFWDCLKKNEATSFGGVPYTYEMLNRLRFYSMKLPSLRYMTQAGGKLAPELHKKFAEYAINNNKKFYVMYGQCEATARMSYLPYEKSLEKYGSVGVPIPGGMFEVIGTDGEIITDFDIVGELRYQGDNVTLGYAECGKDLILGDERNGILLTGDMAKRDKDGYYYIVGRKKRFLKIYGNRVNLDEIDRLIKDKFNYIDCASCGIDDHMVIFITDEKLLEDVKDYISNVTKLNLAAFKVKLIDSIPKNDAGKILYRELDKKI